VFAGWVAFALVSLRHGGRRWAWVALCPVLLSLLIGYITPRQVVNGKLPQQFIHANDAILRHSKFILSNSVGVATAMSWELKRDDVKMYREHGELTYGLGYPDAQDRFVSEEDFPAWLAEHRQQGDVAVVLRLAEGTELPSSLPTPDVVTPVYPLVLVVYSRQP